MVGCIENHLFFYSFPPLPVKLQLVRHVGTTRVRCSYLKYERWGFQSLASLVANGKIVPVGPCYRHRTEFFRRLLAICLLRVYRQIYFQLALSSETVWRLLHIVKQDEKSIFVGCFEVYTQGHRAGLSRHHKIVFSDKVGLGAVIFRLKVQVRAAEAYMEVPSVWRAPVEQLKAERASLTVGSE